MKKISSIIFRVLIITSICISCDDVFENDISNSSVTLNTPEDGLVIETDSLSFAWELVDDADSYRFQLRNEISNIIEIDSVLQTNILDLAIEPNEYSWRVKAMNFGYETEFTFPRDLKILLPNDLSNDLVILSSPVNDTYLNAGPLSLIWDTLEGAENYSITIDRVVNDINNEVISEIDLQDTMYTIESSILEEEGEYLWSIRAINDASQSLYSSSVFFIDNTLPPSAIILDPEDETALNVGDTTTFTWVLPVDEGVIQSPISSVLEISNTSTFDVLLVDEILDTLSYDYQIPTGFDELWWRVRLVDEAGNLSENSEERKIIIE